MNVYQISNSTGHTNNDIHIYHNTHHVTHFHRDIELIYVQEGTLRITVEGRTCTATAEKMALVLSNQLHAMECSGDTSYLVHVFSQDNVPAFAKLITDKRPASALFDCSPSVRDFYLTYCIAQGHRSSLALKSGLYAICNEFYENSTWMPFSQTVPDLLHQMLSHIASHYAEEITLEKMARELGYEMHYLSRVFSRGVHMNLRQYIHLYRIDHAKERLLHSADPISDIALECGFQSIRNFNRIFLECTGMTPKEYRGYFSKYPS